MRKGFFLLLTSVIFLSACNKKSDKCHYVESNVVAPQTEIDSLQHYLTLNSIVAIQHPSGLFYRIDTLGTGAVPAICSTVSVTYQGSLLSNGYIFEAQATPIDFALGAAIAGWQKGLMLTKAGSYFTLYIPPSLAYGQTDVRNNMGQVIVPANSYLKFVIKLHNVS
ncbi:MAG: FKBP-type peptidyl-prolyl cis-trans isomerase [Chitinophagaceae bacterium]|nr:FKBP-type peptidyl-prolyl cis-trans isomerase [Bacteroidota bacterium]MCC6258523.1 FKBP-type peptidyl-prolyl cis-trans isomerase [Chitinophagaceae bacterium]MCW5917285.1 FKBP-type peptidyl-prolyl cis-trans isomerase [Ferruginibacter sp.]